MCNLIVLLDLYFGGQNFKRDHLVENSAVSSMPSLLEEVWNQKNALVLVLRCAARDTIIRIYSYSVSTFHELTRVSWIHVVNSPGWDARIWEQCPIYSVFVEKDLMVSPMYRLITWDYV